MVVEITALEFYSGIGGMHYGFEEAHKNSRVLAAFDINTSANSIYTHNFKETKLCQNNIEAIAIHDLDSYDADLWMMSPPCQPFTKKGLQLGENDRRCDSLKVILKKLQQMTSKPRFIFVENVVGFETSSIHEILLDTLKKLGYQIEEYILSPMQFGIPNSRPRYYLLATLRKFPVVYKKVIKETHKNCVSVDRIRKISEFAIVDLFDDSLIVQKAIVAKYQGALDVICPHSQRSACFTKSYGSFMSGCGSYFVADEKLISNNRLCSSDSSQVRRLSPREVANLMCFPEAFSWPCETSSKQLYRTLGNSVNVRVVAELLKTLISGDSYD